MILRISGSLTQSCGFIKFDFKMILLSYAERLCFCLFCSADKQEEGLLGLGNLRSFTFRELHVATDGFSSKNILGAGGFGNVYRGKLVDGTMVAVKRLKDVNGASGNSQFRTELEMISLAVHRNLLRLIGYCANSSERLLVYPYMSNGSVASRLKGIQQN